MAEPPEDIASLIHLMRSEMKELHKQVASLNKVLGNKPAKTNTKESIEDKIIAKMILKGRQNSVH